MYNMNNSFWGLLNIIFNNVIKIVMFLMINFEWVLYDGKGKLNVKIAEMSKHNKYPVKTTNI